MAECNHVFIGKADGVHCNKCDLSMNTMEYARYQQLKAQNTQLKRQTGKKVKT